MHHCLNQLTSPKAEEKATSLLKPVVEWAGTSLQSNLQQQDDSDLLRSGDEILIHSASFINRWSQHGESLSSEIDWALQIRNADGKVIHSFGKAPTENVEAVGYRIPLEAGNTELELSMWSHGKSSSGTAEWMGYITLLALFLLTSVLFWILRKQLMQAKKHHLGEIRSWRSKIGALQRISELNKLLNAVIEKVGMRSLLCKPSGEIEYIFNSGEMLESPQAKGHIAELSEHPNIHQLIEEVRLSREELIYQTKTFDAEQKEQWIRTRICPIFDLNDQLAHLLFIDEDITELQVLRWKDMRKRSIPQAEEHIALRIQSDLRLSYRSEGAAQLCDIWGLALGRCIERPAMLNAVQTCLREGVERSLKLCSQQRVYKLSFVPSADKSHVDVMGEDITEKTAKSTAASRSEKWETPGAPLERGHLVIHDRLNYAKEIQAAMLPGEDDLRRHFREAFVLSLPKKKLSADFFWIHELLPGSRFLLALGDCAGSESSGAMLSVIARSLLSDLARKGENHRPSVLLQKLNHELERTLRQKQLPAALMSKPLEISLVYIDREAKTLEYAGASRPLYWMNGKLNVLKGNRVSIGGRKHFEKNDLQSVHASFSKGDCLYFFSDGITNQFGGPRDKKLLPKGLRKLIEDNYRYSMQVQSGIFRKAFELWKGDREQVDDATVIGIKL